ncbi:MAG: PEGA domain-containing protein [Myxococcota bacterium]
MKTCPQCERQFEDDEQKCPDDGAVLVKSGVKNNPVLPGVRTVANDARTAMFTLEEFQKEKERLDAGDNPLLSDDDAETASTISPMLRRDDRDATRALTPEQLEQMRAEREGRKNGVAAPALAQGTIPETAKEPETQQTAAIRRKKKDKEKTEATRGRKSSGEGSKVGIVVAAVVGALVLLGGGVGAYMAFLRKVSLEVVSVPPGAIVLVDSVELGAAPLKADVKPGAHSVRARLEGYEEFADVVDVPASGKSFVATLQKLGGKRSGGGNDPIQQKADELHKEARELMARGDHDAAEAKLRALAALVPEDNRAAEALAELSRKRSPTKSGGTKAGGEREGGDDEKGDDDVNVAKMKPAQRSKLAQKQLDDARTAYDLGEMARAKDLLTKCVRYDPKKAPCHRYLARVYTKEDNNEKVKYHLERYLELGGNDDDFKVRDWLRSH